MYIHGKGWNVIGAGGRTDHQARWTWNMVAFILCCGCYKKAHTHDRRDSANRVSPRPASPPTPRGCRGSLPHRAHGSRTRRCRRHRPTCAYLPASMRSPIAAALYYMYALVPSWASMQIFQPKLQVERLVKLCERSLRILGHTVKVPLSFRVPDMRLADCKVQELIAGKGDACQLNKSSRNAVRVCEKLFR